MEVSFLMSCDEVFTIISLMPNRTPPGERFIRVALAGAKECGLQNFVGKNMARLTDDGYVLDPVIKMIADAMARPDSATFEDEVWLIKSPWISLTCEKCSTRVGHLKITPVTAIDN